MEFIPFDATEDEIAARAVLRPGVPKGMRAPLVAWIVSRIASNRLVRYSQFYEMENNLDISFGLTTSSAEQMRASDAERVLKTVPEQSLIRITDFVLHKSYLGTTPAAELQRVLDEGRSKYAVVEREQHRYRLTTREPEGVQDAAEALMSANTAAGRLLAKAWGYVHDLAPNDSAAYASAVKAVEAAAFPVLGVDSEAANATLSTAVRAIEKKDATWRLPFQREHTEYPSRDVLLGMLKSMYRGQRDRHGSEAYSDVTHDEALAAVLMAVTLVGWFAGGLVQERDAESFG